MRSQKSGQFLAVPMEDRVWCKVEKTSSCWLWRGAIDGRGYGFVSVGPQGKQRRHRVHMLIYRMVKGDYDPTLELHHLCRVKHCCNPDHLSPITAAEHRRLHNCGFRTTRCSKGHPYTKESTYISPSGSRTCRICNLHYTHLKRDRKRTPTGRV